MLRSLVSCLRPVRFSSSSAALSDQDIATKVMSVLKQFDKADKTKIEESRPFTELGLDSLDQVELIIAFEDEFQMELTDDVAENIKTPKDAVQAIKRAFEARQ